MTLYCLLIVILLCDFAWFYEISLHALTMKRNRIDGKWESDYKIGSIGKNTKKDIASWKIFISGGISGISSWIVGYPIDTIKTRLQSGLYSNEITLKALKGNYSKSYTGLMPAIYRAALLHSSIFLMYEHVLQTVDNYGISLHP